MKNLKKFLVIVIMATVLIATLSTSVFAGEAKIVGELRAPIANDVTISEGNQSEGAQAELLGVVLQKEEIAFSLSFSSPGNFFIIADGEKYFGAFSKGTVNFGKIFLSGEIGEDFSILAGGFSFPGKVEICAIGTEDGGQFGVVPGDENKGFGVTIKIMTATPTPKPELTSTSESIPTLVPAPKATPTTEAIATPTVEVIETPTPEPQATLAETKPPTNFLKVAGILIVLIFVVGIMLFLILRKRK